MLDSLKERFGQKVTNCIAESNAKINTKIESLDVKICDFSQRLEDLEKKVVNSSEFISTEYVLDSLRSFYIKKPRVLVLGYYGGRNLGDELMLRSVIKRLDLSRVDLTIMLDTNLEIDVSQYAPHNVIHCPKKNDDILAIAQNYDYIVWGGGAVLDDVCYNFTYSRISLAYILLKTSAAAIRLNKKVFVLGVSTNKVLANSEMIKDLQFVAKGARFFSLRDENSLKTVKKAGIECAGIKIIDDLVIPDLPLMQYGKRADADEINVGLSFLMNDDNIEALGVYVEKTIKALLKERPSKKVNVHLIPFYSSNRFDSDEVFFRRLQDMGSLKTASEVVVHDFSDNIEELCSTITGCDLFITMRYHGALIASMLGVKTLVIDHSNQHRHYYNKLDYLQKHYCDFDKIDFDDINNQASVDLAIMKLLSQKALPYSRDKIDASKRELSKILKQIN